VGVELSDKAVVFDIGGVLERVDDDTWPGELMARWEQQANVPAGHLAEVLAGRLDPDAVATGAIAESALRSLYAEALQLDEDSASRMTAEFWDAYCGELDTTLADYLRGLRPAYRTALLSNSADGARREEERRFGLSSLVDFIVYSHEVGLAKPDPRIYQLTEERLGVRGEEIVYVDDVGTHVDAARARGWHAVLHRDTAETIRKVSALLRNTQNRMPR
jgi:putative hydrolase of the HAD superfamily